MTISAGTKLGPYLITDQIGKGGMGEVYRATDTRLDRAVAIKVLRQEMADNRERRERFEREARTISSLNHPHICTLYDVGEQDGTHFLVMELVEGQTLEQRLQKGGLPLAEALKYTIQIADALDKAHRQGVVHRDLKPGNVMITRSGVKLLDFGLAKLKGDAATASGLSQAPTHDRALTTEGTILGTLQYMAPEQLEGKDADSRSDIFAFGAVVYEMVTGQKAFNGTSQASLIGAIMNSEPKSMTEVQEMTPAGLDHIVRTCLAKDPEDRWQTARDLMRELRRVGTGASPGTPISVPSAPPRGRQLAKFAVAAIAGALLASGLFFLSRFREDAVATQTMVTRLTLPLTPVKSLNTYSLSRNFAISRDGRKVVFTDSGNVQLWIRDLQEDEATNLPGTECRGCDPVFSPDGESVAYFNGTQLAKVSVHGGAPDILCDAGTGIRGISWGPDGYIVFTLAGTSNTVLMRVHENGGTAVPLLPAPVDALTHWPFIIDGGRAVIFSAALNGQNFDQGNIQLFDLETKKTKVFTQWGWRRRPDHSRWTSDICPSRKSDGGSVRFEAPGSSRATRFDIEWHGVRRGERRGTVVGGQQRHSRFCPGLRRQTGSCCGLARRAKRGGPSHSGGLLRPAAVAFRGCGRCRTSGRGGRRLGPRLEEAGERDRQLSKGKMKLQRGRPTVNAWRGPRAQTTRESSSRDASMGAGIPKNCGTASAMFTCCNTRRTGDPSFLRRSRRMQASGSCHSTGARLRAGR